MREKEKLTKNQCFSMLLTYSPHYSHIQTCFTSLPKQFIKQSLRYNFGKVSIQLLQFYIEFFDLVILTQTHLLNPLGYATRAHQSFFFTLNIPTDPLIIGSQLLASSYLFLHVLSSLNRPASCNHCLQIF